MKKLLFLMIMSLSLHAYDLGRGINIINDPTLTMKLGGHVSLDFESKSDSTQKRQNTLNIENIGAILYGRIFEDTSYLAEVGNDDSYQYNFNSDAMQNQDLELKRLYLSYDFNNALTVKAGRFLTPIGIWNPTYINALRWTTVRPFVAQEFFPDIITGIQLQGHFGKDDAYEYVAFKQLKSEETRSVSKIPTSDFFGSELRRHFGVNSRLAFVAGHYKSLENEEDAWLSGINAQVELEEDEFSAELLYKNASWKENSWEDLSWYLQYTHLLQESHYVVGRIGQKERFNNWNYLEGLLGYVYRPTPALSIKTEIRHIEKQGKSDYHDNQLFFSFSVLF